MKAQEVPQPLRHYVDPGFDNAEGSQMTWYDDKQFEQMPDTQKLYLYANMLKGGPNISHKRIVWTNWICGVVLILAIAAAIWIR